MILLNRGKDIIHKFPEKRNHFSRYWYLKVSNGFGITANDLFLFLVCTFQVFFNETYILNFLNYSNTYIFFSFKSKNEGNHQIGYCCLGGNEEDTLWWIHNQHMLPFFLHAHRMTESIAKLLISQKKENIFPWSWYYLALWKEFCFVQIFF